MPHVLAEKVADTTVLLDPLSGEYFSLDEIGGAVWDLCDGSNSLQDIWTALTREYDAPSSVDDDVGELVAALAGEGLVELG
jgi:hypothetical protein